jgi:superfamily II DNA/RNA helicase
MVLDEADRLLDMGLGEQVLQSFGEFARIQWVLVIDGVTWRSALVSQLRLPSKVSKGTLLEQEQ